MAQFDLSRLRCGQLVVELETDLIGIEPPASRTSFANSTDLNVRGPVDT
jgi:hypothetical protein